MSRFAVFRHSCGAALLFALLLMAACVGMPAFAWADEGASECVLTEEMRAAYEADGTLDERMAYQEALQNDTFSEGLIAQAVAREQAAQGIALSSVPAEWASGMATTGRAHVLAVRVAFPDYSFEANDTVEALQGIIGPSDPNASAPTGSSAYPYESLSAYYYRSSYGKLLITGETFDYTAQHERDYYTNHNQQLFEEVAAALDAQTDLARFDANGDGYLDAIYLHFAGPNTGWGSAWWSQQTNIDRTIEYGQSAKVRLKNEVLLMGNSAEEWSARTIIHETGHVLGLPDYYSSAAQTGTATGRSGILTYDMMMQNLGDHNGYSKWLLGWLDDSQVTRVVASKDDITVKRGGQVIEQHSATTDPVTGVVSTPDVAQTLEAYASNTASETGGIIVLSNEDEGPFASLYVLEYDACAGNQSVQYRGSDQVVRDVPAGFRMYRVRGELNAAGTGYAYDNLGGSVNNQFIELVDADMSAAHTSDSSYAPSDAASTEYGCALVAGSAVTPTSYPSTNFYENRYVGFTGLCVKVVESGDAQGTVKIHYSSDGEPAPATELTLTPETEAVTNACMVTLTASSPVVVTSDASILPQVVVDGEVVSYLFGTEADGTTVTTPLFVNPDELPSGTEFEIVYPAGMFLLNAGTASAEVRVKLTVADGATALAQAGNYPSAGYLTSPPAVSELLSCGDGKIRFFQANNQTLYLHTVSPDDYASLQTLALVGSGGSGAGSPAETGAGESSGTEIAGDATIAAALALDDGRLFVAVDNGLRGLQGFFVDAEGTIIAQGAFTSLPAYGTKYVAAGSSVLVTAYTSTRYAQATNLMTIAPAADGSLQTRYATTTYATPQASNGYLMMEHNGSVGQSEYGTTSVDVYAARDVAALVDERGAAALDEASLDEALLEAAPRKAALSVNEPRIVTQVCATQTGFWLLLGGDFSEANKDGGMVVAFSADGAETARHAISDASSSYETIYVGDHGTVALSKKCYAKNTTIAYTETVFCDQATLEPLSTLRSGASVRSGRWTSDGRWLCVGKQVTSFGSSAGGRAPAGQDGAAGESAGTTIGESLGTPLHYVLTEVLDPAPDPDPTPQPGPDPQPGPGTDPGSGSSVTPADSPASPNDAPKHLANTGDVALPLAGAALGGTVAAGLGLARSRKRCRR